MQSHLLGQSVKLGCPLSPLLFIMAFDVLGSMLQDALNTGSIVGVGFPKLGLRTLQNMFADDLSMIIRALLCYILELQRILHAFGEASGLICA